MENLLSVLIQDEHQARRKLENLKGMDSFPLKPQDRESCKDLGPTGSLQAGIVLCKSKTDLGDWSLSLFPVKLLQDFGQMVKAPQQLPVLVVALII